MPSEAVARTKEHPMTTAPKRTRRPSCRYFSPLSYSLTLPKVTFYQPSVERWAL
ncbi:MAG: hypothetical protein GY788_21225 [bacterium]|nr:hypothetical protein [bacterium]